MIATSAASISACDGKVDGAAVGSGGAFVRGVRICCAVTEAANIMHMHSANNESTGLFESCRVGCFSTVVLARPRETARGGSRGSQAQGNAEGM